MKTTTHLLAVVVASTALSLTASAETGSKTKVSATDSELQAVAVQYGQSGTITYFKPAGREFTVAVYKSKTDGAVAEVSKRSEPKWSWRSQSAPNGNAVTYLTPSRQ